MGHDMRSTQYPEEELRFEYERQLSPRIHIALAFSCHWGNLAIL